MARTTHVAKAQQRYETVPVLDEHGDPKKTPVMKKVKDYDTGEVTEVQKTTKTGREVFMTVTVQDKSKPLPNYTCDSCGKEIEVGTPYKHITPKSGPYGGRKRTRHESCPNWQVWEYSSSMSAELARISYDFFEAVGAAESPDDVTSALSDAAGEVKEIAEQKREGASNIEEGFGHPTSASEELESIAEQLDEWAEEIESADVPEMTECEECTDGQVDCEDCEGTGTIALEDNGSGGRDCETCSGDGTVDCETCDGTGEDIEAWRDEVRDNVTIVDESPV
jgi:hypothetical protein